MRGLRTTRTLVGIVAAVLLEFPAWATAAPPLPPAPNFDWRRVATHTDLLRIHDWRDAFVKGLMAAKAAGFSDEITREGALLEPDAALDTLKLPAGRYRCRTIKLGSRDGRSPRYVANSAIDCGVTGEGAVMGFAEVSGMQRPTGLLFKDGDHRRIFLGTMTLGDERRAMHYGQDDDRDLAGSLERIGTSRWRLVLPYPRFESLVDVVELVPSN